ncbi:ATP-dependent DNA helicase RecG [Thauera sp. CAU 1555]|uniref:ATP-dependent DNA helicase RecG n=1 Tax=Thauera sedimentorum TaxID=2767595 RepID=A0ABR9BBE4_9RHOO|nr:ATP-dependent DNA helicase RecG [Thauera sedimentorum]MBC9072597.1 ATP-dependent DNA helicase RecG [Thauera sedimentorum]MBD8503516.1 ATP-dependent DNA helicase RecG [Thauera sedimentorum]
MAREAASGWPGVNAALAGRLAKLDLRGPRDLLLHLPLRYEDETRLTPIAAARAGFPAQIEGEVTSCEVSLRPRRQLVARVRDASGTLVARWLHFYPSQQKQLAVGRRVRLFGEVRGGFFGDEMVHPRVHPVAEGEGLPEALTPVYPTTAGVGQATLRKLIDRALASEPLDDGLPEALRRRFDLPAFADALRLLHHPPPEVPASVLEDRQHPAWRRIKFEELLAQQISLRRAYLARRAKSAPRLAGGGRLAQALVDGLPFALTGAQRRAVAEIGADLAVPHPMQRLLMGDVGSGKTIVAALAMLQAVDAGWQAALMAPTEILAEQHWQKMSAWLAPLGLEVTWLSGSRGKRAREAELARLASGELRLAVGTHALIEDPVALPQLGLAVVDEQHRFGVRQRLALREKGGAGAMSPHLLMMSATPIPRTLAMSHYADLDVSVLDELPPGRSPVLTKLVSDARREEVVARVRDGCLAGRQAYWVCPLIEESEALQLQTAQDTYATLCEALPELRIGLVHGRLKPAEKSATMAAFAAGELHLLVATTVIEVGVDVPNASLMVIEHAERFGLAQLHQLRGRVGRGTAESVCILLYAQPLSQTGRARLKVIFENSDGFAIAREDLHIRGPGEFVGARQSGLPLLRYADLESDADLLEAARDAAETLLREDPPAAAALMARWLGGREGLLRA